MVCNTNNQNCSFYLTPSSGHHTPIQLNCNKSSKILTHYQQLTDRLPENLLIAEEFKKSSSLLRESIKNKAATNNIQKVKQQEYVHIPFESMMTIDFVNVEEKSRKSLIKINLSNQQVDSIQNIQNFNQLQIINLSHNQLTCLQGFEVC